MCQGRDAGPQLRITRSASFRGNPGYVLIVKGEWWSKSRGTLVADDVEKASACYDIFLNDHMNHEIGATYASPITIPVMVYGP